MSAIFTLFRGSSTDGVPRKTKEAFVNSFLAFERKKGPNARYSATRATARFADQHCPPRG
jgi:hypothetical protein